jgi:hypothetical protein
MAPVAAREIVNTLPEDDFVDTVYVVAVPDPVRVLAFDSDGSTPTRAAGATLA